MNKLYPGCLALVCLLPLTAGAQVSAGDLPDNTVWYLHADLEAMREQMHIDAAHARAALSAAIA